MRKNKATFNAPWASSLRNWWISNPDATKIARQIIDEIAKNSWYYGPIWDWLYLRYYRGYTYPQIYKMWETVDPGTINVYIRTYSRKLWQELKNRGLI